MFLTNALDTIKVTMMDRVGSVDCYIYLDFVIYINFYYHSIPYSGIDKPN